MPQLMTKACLSEKDQRILESIFNPLELTSALSPQLIEADSTLPLHDADDDDDNDDNIIDKEGNRIILEQSKQLEIEGVKLAEHNQLVEALSKFSAALNLTPKRASILNNRAQVLRLLQRDDEALEDLNQAISNACRQLKSKCHALCQRGVLYRKRNQNDLARKDFDEAAKMGSQFAKTQLVEINPYAALCNQVLRQIFDELK